MEHEKLWKEQATEIGQPLVDAGVTMDGPEGIPPRPKSEDGPRERGVGFPAAEQEGLSPPAPDQPGRAPERRR